LLCSCSCSSCCWGVINQNTAIFANFAQFHHAFVIAQNIALLSYFTMHSAALPGSLARQPCPAALPGSLARQPCPAVRSISTGFDAGARSLRSHRTVLQWQVTKLHARAAVLNGLNLFLVQFHHAFIICMRALLSSRQVQTCSVVQLFLCRSFPQFIASFLRKRR
jgi:hypothetical protein